MKPMQEYGWNGFLAHRDDFSERVAEHKRRTQAQLPPDFISLNARAASEVGLSLHCSVLPRRPFER
jgi:hypothetical protein